MAITLLALALIAFAAALVAWGMRRIVRMLAATSPVQPDLSTPPQPTEFSVGPAEGAWKAQ